LKPGEQFNQNQLADQLGCSPTPVREALHALAAKGLVSFTHGAGAQVAPITMAGIIEHTELAVALETATLRKAAPLLTDEDLDELDRRLAALENLKNKRDWFSTAWAFYDKLLSPCGYPMLMELIEKSIFQNMLVMPLFAEVRPEVLAMEPNLHTVLAACRERDIDRAVKALADFNQRACMATIEVIQNHLDLQRNYPAVAG
jgi:DNA-binding GntR family transcriptional regulator